jgi:hypothetical protein
MAKKTRPADEHKRHLRAVYLQAFDDFATDPVDVARSYPDGTVNTRYARELLGTLTTAGLLGNHFVNGENEVWQVISPGTYDEYDRSEAETIIDSWLERTDVEAKPEPVARPAKKATAKRPVSASAPKPCGCGCGEQVGRRATYRPGHDARHASAVGLAIFHRREGSPQQDVSDLLEPLSAALRAKALHQASRLEGRTPNPASANEHEKAAIARVVATVRADQHMDRSVVGGVVSRLPTKAMQDEALRQLGM